MKNLNLVKDLFGNSLNILNNMEKQKIDIKQLENSLNSLIIQIDRVVKMLEENNLINEQCVLNFFDELNKISVKY